MSLCLDITQANTGRAADRKESANLPARLFSHTWATIRTEIKTASGDASPSPGALMKHPITESPTMRSLLLKDITIPIAFKAIRCGRRAQLWNRQASIIRDLTKLAFRHGWCCLPI